MTDLERFGQSLIEDGVNYIIYGLMAIAIGSLIVGVVKNKNISM
jgi:hypothetical protein